MANQNIKDWRSKSAKDLIKKLHELQTELKDVRFKASTSELKNVRSLRNLKRDIACLLTIIKEKA